MRFTIKECQYSTKSDTQFEVFSSENGWIVFSGNILDCQAFIDLNERGYFVK